MEKQVNNTVRVLVKEPNKPPYEKEIPNKLEEFQAIVDGLIDVMQLKHIKGVDIIVNDEFLNEGMEGNFFVPELSNCVCGSCCFVGFNPNTGEHISLTDKQIKASKEYIKYFEIPIGLDLYKDYPILKPFMDKQYRKYKNNQQEM